MHNEENDRQPARTYPVFTWVLSGLAIALVGATVFSLVQLVREQRNVRELAASRDGLSAALNQTRSQLQALETKLDALSAPPRTVKAPLAPVRTARTPMRRPATRPPVDDPRWERLQSQLSEQQKQIADAREEAGKTGADLRGRLDSTRDELNGSIAKRNAAWRSYPSVYRRRTTRPKPRHFHKKSFDSFFRPECPGSIGVLCPGRRGNI